MQSSSGVNSHESGWLLSHKRNHTLPRTTMLIFCIIAAFFNSSPPYPPLSSPFILIKNEGSFQQPSEVFFQSLWTCFNFWTTNCFLHFVKAHYESQKMKVDHDIFFQTHRASIPCNGLRRSMTMEEQWQYWLVCCMGWVEGNESVKVCLLANRNQTSDRWITSSDNQYVLLLQSTALPTELLRAWWSQICCISLFL